MRHKEILKLDLGNAICYSGYRENQSPLTQTYPTYEQTQEDLHILAKNWKFIRLYDCSKHTEIILEVIKNDNLDLKVMLGAPIGAEMNNRECPWGAHYTLENLENNRKQNKAEIQKMINLAKTYSDKVFAVSVGNEATVNWSDHIVKPERVIEFVRMVKAELDIPVTFCENYEPWLGKLEELAEEVDFISLHTYPAWEYKDINDAMQYTIENYYSVADKYKHKRVVITEAGWPTKSDGRGIMVERANEDNQKQYYDELMGWSREQGVLAFVFEAFDEPWKGSPDSDEPEKHWGLFNVERKQKKVMKDKY